MSQNQHGLSRTIPSSVKKEVRKACGFGCVICGATIYEYEHFDPDFKDAFSHSAAGIALLCPSHHAEVTKGVISKNVVKNARGMPAALREGFSKRSLPYFNGDLVFSFAGGLAVNTPIPIIIGDEALFRLSFPEDNREPVSISARIRDDAGKVILLVEDNEWKVSTNSADFEWIGTRYIFRNIDHEVVLIFDFSVENCIICEYINTCINGRRLKADRENIYYGGRNISIQGSVVSNCTEGFCFF